MQSKYGPDQSIWKPLCSSSPVSITAGSGALSFVSLSMSISLWIYLDFSTSSFTRNKLRKSCSMFEICPDFWLNSDPFAFSPNIVESKEDVNDRNNNSTTVSDVKCEPLVNDNQIFQNDDVYDSGNLVIDSEPEFGKEIKNEVKFDSPKGLLDDGMNVTSKSELELKKVDDFSLKQEQLEVNFKTFEGLRHQLEDQSLYSCDLCGREFPWKTSLRRHIESVHNGRRYHCDQCDFKATRNYCLVEHKRRKHSIIKE